MQRDRLVTGVFFGILALSVGLAATLDTVLYSKFDKRHHLDRQQIAFVRPGLQLEVQAVDVTDAGTVQVTFTLMDDLGLPLDRMGVFTPGPIRVRFVLANIPSELNHYQAYTTTLQTSPITGLSALHPSQDFGGVFEEIADGTYIYTFGTRLPPDFEVGTTHSVGIYADRDLREFDLGRQIANEVVNFVPSGQEVLQIRDLVRTADCNSCHDPMGAHGGFRTEVELCVLCHYPGVVDPDTGNSVDFPEMTHKIHRGADLPSVQTGTPYQIIGFRQSVVDYSEVRFPRDIRECRSCHSDNAAQAQAHLLRPSSANCGSCHDEVDFETGENHVAGPASDDSCSFCHMPFGDLEFDASVAGAHTIPSQSSQLEGVNAEILEIRNTQPGQKPTVVFTIQDNSGVPIEPSQFNVFNLVISGPNTDYDFLAVERPTGLVPALGPAGTNALAYTFDQAIPDDAVGSFAVSIEARRSVTINTGTEKEMTVRESAENPVLFFSVTGDEVVPRRMLVSDEKCENCHGNLTFHGDIRHNATDYCQTCHQAASDDSFRRPPEASPPRSIDFKFMIHRIHTGEELTGDYTLYGFGGNPTNFNEVLYSGDLRNCAACHVGDSYQLPSAGILPTVDENEFFSPIPPNSAACLSCHDTIDSAAHAFVNIAPFGEACAACHGEGREFAVEKLHAR